MDIGQSSSSAERSVSPFISRRTITERLTMHSTEDAVATHTQKEQGNAEKSNTEKDPNLFKSRKMLAKTVGSNHGKDAAAAIRAEKEQGDAEKSSSNTEKDPNLFKSKETLAKTVGSNRGKDAAAIRAEKEQGDAEKSSSSTEKDPNLFKSKETLAKTVGSNRGKDAAAIRAEKEEGDAKKSSSNTEKDPKLFKSKETLAKTVGSNREKDAAAIRSEKEQGDAEKSSSNTEKDPNLAKSRETLAKNVRSNSRKDSARILTENGQASSEQSSSSPEKNLNHFTSRKTHAETVTSHCEKNTADIHAEKLNTNAEVSPFGGFDQPGIDEGQQCEVLSQTKCPCGFSNTENESQESESSLRDAVGAFNNGICGEIFDPRDLKTRMKGGYIEESDDENDCSSILSECFDIVEQTNSNKETDNYKLGDIEEAGCAMFGSEKPKQKNDFQQRKSTSQDVVKTAIDESCEDINKLGDNEVWGEIFDGGSDCSLLSECFDMVKEMDNFSHDKNDKENGVQDAKCTMFSDAKSKKDDRHEFEESESKVDAQVLNGGSYKNMNKRSDKEVCRENCDEESQESECSMLSECFDIVKQSDGNREMYESHDENGRENGELNYPDKGPVRSNFCGAKEQIDRMSPILFDSCESEDDDGQQLERDTSASKQSYSKESCCKPLDHKESSICSMDIDEPNKLIGVVNAREKVDNMDLSNPRSSNNDLISNQNDTIDLPVRTKSPLQAEEDIPDEVNQPSSNDLPSRRTHQKDEPSSKDIGYPKHVNNKQKKIVATVKPLVKITDVRSLADHSICACRLNDEKHTTPITNTSVVHGADGQGTELSSTDEQTSSSEDDLSPRSRRNDIINTLETVIHAFNNACSAVASPKDNNNNDKTSEKNSSNCLPSGSAQSSLTTATHSPNIWESTPINSEEILSSILLTLEEFNRRADLSIKQKEMTNESRNNSRVNPAKLLQSVVSSEEEKLSSSGSINEPESQINEDQPESNMESCEDQRNDGYFIESQQRVKTVFSSNKEGTKEVLDVGKGSENLNQPGGKGDDESTSVASCSTRTQVCSINQNPNNSSDNVERTFRNICHDHRYSVNTNSKEALDVSNVSANENLLGGKGDSLITNDPASDGSSSVASCSANTQVCSLIQNPDNSSDNAERTFRNISHDHCYSVNTNSEKEAVDVSKVSANKDQLGPEALEISTVSANKDQLPLGPEALDISKVSANKDQLPLGPEALDISKVSASKDQLPLGPEALDISKVSASKDQLPLGPEALDISKVSASKDQLPLGPEALDISKVSASKDQLPLGPEALDISKVSASKDQLPLGPEALDISTVSANKDQLPLGPEAVNISKVSASKDQLPLGPEVVNISKVSANKDQLPLGPEVVNISKVSASKDQLPLGPEALNISKVSAHKNQQGDVQENDESTSAARCSANAQVCSTDQNSLNSSHNVERTFVNIFHDHNYSVNKNYVLKKVPKKQESSSGEQHISAQIAREKEHEESIPNISHDHCSSANDANCLDLNRKRSSTSKLSPQLPKKRANKASQPGVFTSNGNILVKNKGLNLGVQSDTGKLFKNVCTCSNDTAQDSQSIDVGKTPVIKVEKIDSTTSLTQVLPRNPPTSHQEPESSESVNALDPSNAESEENRSSVKSPSIFDLYRPTSLTQDEAVCSCSENNRWSSTDESSLESQENSSAVNKANISDSIRNFVPFIKKENVEKPPHQIIVESTRFKDCSEVLDNNPTKCSDLTGNSNALTLKKEARTDLRSSSKLSENRKDCSEKCTGLSTSNGHLAKSEDLNETSEQLSKSGNLKIMRSYKRKNFRGNTLSWIKVGKRQEINFPGSSSVVRTPDAHAAVQSNFKDHSSEGSNVEESKDSEEANIESSEISVASKHNSDETYEPSDSEASESSTISAYEPSENSQISSYEPTKSSENSNFGESEATGISQFESDETYKPSSPEVCESSTTSDSEPCENSEISSFEPSQNSETSDRKASTSKASKFESDKTRKPLNLEVSESSDASESEPSKNSEKTSFQASENSEMTNFWESESSGDESYNLSNFESSKTSEISNGRRRKNSKKSDFKWCTTTKASNIEINRITLVRKRRCKQKRRVKKTCSLSKYKSTLEAVVKLEKFEVRIENQV